MQKLTLKNRKDQLIVGELTTPQSNIQGVCIVQHGYGGSKHEPHIQKLTQVFLDNGFITFNFDVTNSFGESDGDYEKATLQLHYEDLEDVIAWAKEQEWYQGELAITGHSMGGYAVTRYGEEYSSDVDYIASIAPLVSGELSWEAHRRAYPGQLEEWKESGWLVKESKSKPGEFKRKPWSHMEERLNHNLLVNASNLTMPLFLYVGGEDLSIPSEHVQMLFDKIPGNNKEIVVNPGVGHVYRTEEEIEHLYQSVNTWIKNTKNIMEYIDVLTPEGKLTGKSKSKEQIHIDGEWHRAVHIWIINSRNEVLMQRRSKTKVNYPDMWDISVAGHVSAGEVSLLTAFRETEEEIGITIIESDLKHIGELTQETVINNGTYINKEYNDIYLIHKDIELSEMKKQEEEVGDLKYISLDELKEWVNNKYPELVDHEEEFELLFNSL
jgi:isopentenyl-diphosphate delta-isomerase